MTDRKKETLTEIWLRRIKNNRIVAALIIVSIAVAGISAFTESASKLYHLFLPQPKHSAEPSATPTYTVEIMALPVTANQGARRQPHEVNLELHSGRETQRIITVNYPITRLFAWSPKTSDNVVLLISIGDIILKKEYPGHLGFPEFLREFHSGNRVFRPNEFGADQSAILKKYGVEFISVSFGIRGAQPIVQYLSQ